MKKLIILLVIGIMIAAGVGVTVVYINRDSIAEGKLQEALHDLLRVPVKLEGTTFNPQSGNIHINRIEINNLKEKYGESYLAVITDVDMDLNAKRFFQEKKFRVGKLTARIDEMHVVRRKDGNVNIRDIHALTAEFLDQKIAPQSRQDPDYRIDRVELDFGKIILKEEVRDGEFKTTVKDLGDRRDVYGFVVHPSVLVQVPVLKAISDLGRGSMGIPRTKIQRNLLELTGQR